MTVQACNLPADALLRCYFRDGGYTDCYLAELPFSISLGQYVEAFYTTSLFKAERTILSFAGHASTDADAAQVARGASCCFAAWHVEDRVEDQLLMADVSGRTRSWFKIATISGKTSEHTLLYFGSAITGGEGDKAGRMLSDVMFRALTGPHKFYSRALLSATRRRLASSSVKA